MGYQSLYRKYRPASFAEMVGQSVVVEVIKKSIIKDKIAHAYLFTGPRGTGKTSMAKLLGQAVNCESLTGDVCGVCDNCKETIEGTHPDIVEIDAASNNGVDEIRRLIERVKYTPILGRYKVYIIDEVHMLSQGAFNALLKTLEEPPAHVIFVLATTEIHKVIPTIISRCQRFDFTHIPDDEIVLRLDQVLKQEHIEAEEGVSSAIAKVSGGGLRNALTILEQAIVYADEKIELDDIYELTGMLSSDEQISIINHALNSNMESFSNELNLILKKSHNLDLLAVNFANAIKDSIILSKTKNKDLFSYDDRLYIAFLSDHVSESKRYQMIEIILDYVQKMKFTQNQTSYFELMMLQVYNVLQDNIINDTNRVVTKTTTKTEQDMNKTIGNNEVIASKTKEEKELSKVSLKENIKEKEIENNVSRETLKNKEHESRTEVYKLLEGDKLVSFMVSANKDLRLTDQELIEDFDIHMSDIKWARSYRLVNEANLVLSSNSFVVLSFDEDYQAYESLNKLGNKELRDFFEHLSGNKRYVFATTKKYFQEAVTLFIQQTKDNTLPPGIELEYKETEDEQVDEVLKKASDLFGDKLVIE